MNKDDRRFNAARFLVIVAAFVIIIAGMRAAESILVPFLLSAFLAIICAPPLFWLQRKRLPTVLAVVIVIVGLLGIGFLVGVLVGASLKNLSADLPIYQGRLQERTTALLIWLRGKGFSLSDQILLEYFDPGAVMRLVASGLTRLGSVLTNAFLILLTVIFILFEASSFPTKLRAIWGESNPTMSNADQIVGNVKDYMARKTLVSIATGVAIGIWLSILGVNYALVWGLLAFLLNFVPNIGSFIAAVPAVLLALVQLGVKSALLSGLGFLVVNLVIGWIVEPRFMGRGAGLSTLIVFVSLVFWGWVLGPIGMLLSVPLTMTVKIALESNEETRWIAILLGTEASAKAALETPLKASKPEPPKKSDGP